MKRAKTSKKRQNKGDYKVGYSGLEPIIEYCTETVETIPNVTTSFIQDTQEPGVYTTTQKELQKQIQPKIR